MAEDNSSQQKHYLLDKPSTNLAASIFGLVLFVLLTSSMIIFFRIGIDIYRVSNGQESIQGLMMLSQSIVNESPSGYLSLKIADFLDWVLFQDPGIYQALTQATDPAHPNWTERFVKTFNWQFIVAIQSVHIVGIRIGSIISLLPLVGMVYVLAFVDGMVERGIRTDSAGRESTSIYLHAKTLHWGGMMILMTIYCLWFDAVTNAQAFVAVWLTFVWVSVRLQWKFYKKYW
jgi:hypothetical protein